MLIVKGSIADSIRLRVQLVGEAQHSHLIFRCQTLPSMALAMRIRLVDRSGSRDRMGMGCHSRHRLRHPDPVKSSLSCRQSCKAASTPQMRR